MKFTSKLISFLAGILFFSAIFIFVDFSEVMVVFAKAPTVSLVGFIVVSLLLVTFLVIRWNLVLHSQGFKHIGFFRLLKYWMVGYAVSYVTPSAHIGGEPIRALLLSKEDIPFHEGLSTVLIDKALELTIDLFFAICGIILIVLYFPINSFIKATLVTLLSPCLVLFFFFYWRIFHEKTFLVPLFKMMRFHKIKGFQEWEQKLSQIEVRIIGFFKHDRKAFGKCLNISFILWILMFFEYRFALQIIGFQNIGISNIFMVLSVVGIAYIMPIPAALGILEAAQASLFAVMNASPALGVALSFLIRTRDLIWTAVGLSILAQQGVFSVGKKMAEKISEKNPLGKLRNKNDDQPI